MSKSLLVEIRGATRAAVQFLVGRPELPVPDGRPLVEQLWDEKGWDTRLDVTGGLWEGSVANSGEIVVSCFARCRVVFGCDI